MTDLPLSPASLVIMGTRQMTDLVLFIIRGICLGEYNIKKVIVQKRVQYRPVLSRRGRRPSWLNDEMF